MTRVPILILLAAGCAPRTPYRYTPPAVWNGARGTIELAPRATVGDLETAVRRAFPGDLSCSLWFDAAADRDPFWSKKRIVVASGDLRLTAFDDCDLSHRGDDGVIGQIVLSRDELSGGFFWCRNGQVDRVSTRGTIPSLQHDVERELVAYQGIALAVWSTDDAHWALAIVQRLQAAGIPLRMVSEGPQVYRWPAGHHGCEPGEYAPEPREDLPD